MKTNCLKNIDVVVVIKLHISPFCAYIIGVAVNHLQTGVGKTSMAPTGKDFSWICKGSLWFMVFWEVFVSVLFLPH